ncbi:flagellar biosynthetic protein FliO [Novosphingobium sp. RD2P27]|uniref:Flagellar biosynthetic protein FliO n=1 Tax=Novosphingobium kalidii TaxID=3230299 RepID=A0ABV2CXM4_9SPHN
MDAYALLRTLGALATVLGLLAGALWIVRRYGIRLPGRVSSDGTRRLEVIERTMLDGRRSVALLRRDGREHLILLSPEGNVLLEAGIIRDEIDLEDQAVRLEAQREAMEASKAQNEAMRESFFAMVDKARTGVKDRIEAAQPVVEKVRNRVQPVSKRAKSRRSGDSRA